MASSPCEQAITAPSEQLLDVGNCSGASSDAQLHEVQSSGRSTHWTTDSMPLTRLMRQYWVPSSQSSKLQAKVSDAAASGAPPPPASGWSPELASGWSAPSSVWPSSVWPSSVWPSSL